MITIDNIVGLVAPHICLGCGFEGSQLCDDCIREYIQPVQSKCAGCFKLTRNFNLCSACRKWLPLKHVFITSIYDGISEELLKEYKFKYKRQNATSIAKMMSVNIDGLNDYVLCPIPTAASRVRMRGFDHSRLITNQLSKETGLKVEYFLKRKSNVRQLGSSRKERIEHMKNELFINKDLRGQKVLIVDDVMTSGATLAAAAKVLKKASASEVSAVIFTRQVS